MKESLGGENSGTWEGRCPECAPGSQGIDVAWMPGEAEAMGVKVAPRLGGCAWAVPPGRRSLWALLMGALCGPREPRAGLVEMGTAQQSRPWVCLLEQVTSTQRAPGHSFLPPSLLWLVPEGPQTSCPVFPAMAAQHGADEDAARSGKAKVFKMLLC